MKAFTKVFLMADIIIKPHKTFENMSPCMLINRKYYVGTFETFMLNFHVIYSKTLEINQAF